MFSFRDHLDEKVALAYHKSLNQRIFDDEKLKEDVRHKMLEVALAWQEFAKIPDNLVHDVIFTGGNCNYNFSRYSDIDIHLVMDRYKLFKNKELVDEYLSDKKTLWSLTRKIKIKGYPVEMYAQDKKDILVASGVYSLRYDKWLAKPIHGNYDFKHDEALEKKIDSFEEMVDNVISNGAPESELVTLKKKIINLRKAAMETGDEFSFDNLVFKSLRNLGVLTKIDKYLDKIRDSGLSLK